MNKILHIPFAGEKLITVEQEGVVYVAMKPIVEAIGLDWSTQARKLNNSQQKHGCSHMTTPTQSGIQEMLFIPIKKLNGWLFSINPEKVRSDLKDKIIQYQHECFIVLYEYWQKGEAIREKVQRELEEWREREGISFENGSLAGKQLNVRKKEKNFIATKIHECEFNLIQPDLFK